MAEDNFPREARAVIIGGGVIGCSVAYHLTLHGWRDVVLLEQGRLTCGTTWHAAGLVGQLRAHQNMTRLVQYSASLYQTLEAETGQAVDWHETGSLRLSCSAERTMELRRLTTMAKSFGLPMHIIGADEAQALFPLLSTTDVEAAAFLPTDGYIDPASVTQAIARGARMRGAVIREHTPVKDISVAGPRVDGVILTDGTKIPADVVVLAAGILSWRAAFARAQVLEFDRLGGRPDAVQVMVNGRYVYVGHMFSNGITVLDASDPRNLKPVQYWSLGQGDLTRTHQLQVAIGHQEGQYTQRHTDECAEAEHAQRQAADDHADVAQADDQRAAVRLIVAANQLGAAPHPAGGGFVSQNRVARSSHRPIAGIRSPGSRRE